jgi:predicted nuclease with TOPRIM domain
MGDDNAGLLLALATENAELRQQLASAQDLLVETAIDAGQLHARIEALQAELAEVRARFDALRTEASRMRDGVQRTA